VKIKMTLSPDSIDAAIKKLEDYQKKLENVAVEIAKRLTDLGYSVAFDIMAGHIYSGETITSLQVEQVGENKFVLKAGSPALLFFEFGAGTRGSGHPLDGKFGMGPGTYPGQTHAFDPKGWWFPTDDANLAIRTDKNGQMWAHSYGNPPYKPFYTASQRMKADLLKVAKEVMQDY